MIRLGLDVHGTIDSDPEFFSDLTQLVFERGSEIVIVTGRENNKRLRDKLYNFKVVYNSILSITSYHKSLGTPMKFLDNDPNEPWIDGELWNSTKFKLCKDNKIDIMIDDSPVYGKYFLTYKKPHYILFTPEVKEFLKILFYHGGYKL